MGNCTTDFINDLLLHGGKIRDIHDKINNRQDKQESRGYRSPGYFFNKKHEIQQRTLFGHIAHLIIDELCEIEFGGMKIDESVLNRLRDDECLELQHDNYRKILLEKYEDNEFIRFVMFKGEIR